MCTTTLPKEITPEKRFEPPKKFSFTLKLTKKEGVGSNEHETSRGVVASIKDSNTKSVIYTVQCLFIIHLYKVNFALKRFK